MMRAFFHGLLAGACALAGCGLAPAGTPVAKPRVLVGRVAAKAMPAGYYKGTEGLQGQLLLRALHNVVARHKDLGYDNARDVMFADVDDPDNDDVVSCVYIGRALDRVRDRGSAFRNGNGLNAEHTWPQSKGAAGAAKADLHHLFPADVKANGIRGSYPFGVVSRPEWSDGGSVLGRNTSQQRVFQPRSKQWGDTARAIFYFYTVYGLSGRLDLSNFRIEEPVLRRWHEQDPPSAEERLRNDAVFAVQGNRNPYVDHPEFVARVGAFLRPDLGKQQAR
ncbi:MAG: endonuclease [Candidatus Sericytochromatia bacterium]|nr:endonuclease [Candidatus Sericytochromatia bacterium]